MATRTAVQEPAAAVQESAAAVQEPRAAPGSRLPSAFRGPRGIGIPVRTCLPGPARAAAEVSQIARLRG